MSIGYVEAYVLHWEVKILRVHVADFYFNVSFCLAPVSISQYPGVTTVLLFAGLCRKQVQEFFYRAGAQVSEALYPHKDVSPPAKWCHEIWRAKPGQKKTTNLDFSKW